MKRLFSVFALAAIAATALTGCYKQDPVNRNDGRDSQEPGGREGKDEWVLTERSDWSLNYQGRYSEVQTDGSVSVMERFKLTYTGNSYVIALVITEDDLRNVYGNNLADFFSYEVSLLQSDAKEQPTVPLIDLGVYNSRTSEVFFGRHMHGTWIAYLVELNSKLEMTGQYAEQVFVIPEETPTEAFSRWIGKWTVTDGKYGSFDIEVSDADANYLYYVDGWETGPSVSEKMNQERDWFYARFENDRLIFYAQFLTTEDYEGITVDEVFAGTYLTTTSDAIGDLDWEGVDYEDALAYTVEEESGIMLCPWTILFDNGYSITYNSMRYSRLWFTDNGNTVNWNFYNVAGIPFLPMAMIPTPGTRSSASAPSVRLRSKGTVHRDQLKPVRTVRTRKEPKN